MSRFDFPLSDEEAETLLTLVLMKREELVSDLMKGPDEGPSTPEEYREVQEARDELTALSERLRLFTGDARECDECGRVEPASNAPDWPNGVCTDCEDPEPYRVDVVYAGAVENTTYHPDEATARKVMTTEANGLADAGDVWQVDVWDTRDYPPTMIDRLTSYGEDA